jgi:hypothetical protein
MAFKFRWGLDEHRCFHPAGYYFCRDGEVWSIERIRDHSVGPIGVPCDCECHQREGDPSEEGPPASPRPGRRGSTSESKPVSQPNG